MIRWSTLFSAGMTAFCVAVFCAQPVAAEDQNQEPVRAPAADDLNELEQQFAEKLSGAALVGRFSIDGRENDKPLRPERYEIEKISKLKGDYWVFNARIKYGDADVTLPITLKVLWAGDTPVISLTDLTIPGLGTFTSRVLFYGDRYVGTWQHGKVGGHMWGHIEQSSDGEENGNAGSE